MSPPSQFEQCKADAFKKYGIDPNKPSAPPPAPRAPDPAPAAPKPVKAPDMGSLKRPERTTPPQNGMWKMELGSGKYFILTFVDGEKHGPVTMWSNTDVCLMEGSFFSNILSGPCRLFDGFGRLSSAFTYVNGLVDGYLVSYQPNGLVSYESWYVAGVQEGLMRTYNQYGELGQECMYHNNYRHGKCVTYFPKNQGPCQISYFENGLQTGLEEIFYPDGSLMQSTPYQDGLPIDYPVPLDTKGQPIVNPFTAPQPASAVAALAMSAPWDTPGAKPYVDKTPPSLPILDV